MNIKGIFKGAFPFITTALQAGGPLGTMASNALAKALGVDKVDDPEQAIANATPEQIQALTAAEQEFAKTMASLGFDTIEKLEDIAEKDRDSARNREIQVKDKTPARLAYVLTVGFFLFLALLMFHDVPKESSGIIYAMVGSLGTAWIAAMTYYFGSSVGSDMKTQILARTQDAVNAAHEKIVQFVGKAA